MALHSPKCSARDMTHGSVVPGRIAHPSAISASPVCVTRPRMHMGTHSPRTILRGRSACSERAPSRHEKSTHPSAHLHSSALGRGARAHHKSASVPASSAASPPLAPSHPS
eukprot:1865338-Prymnesium_polylepis.1